MNRRKFFNFLGAAVIGTVVSLKLPETIAPIKLLNWSDNCMPPISFKMLDEAYRRLCKEDREPNCIYIPLKRFNEIRGLTYGYLKFHGADIKVDPHIIDDSLYIENPEFRNAVFEGFSRFEII